MKLLLSHWVASIFGVKTLAFIVQFRRSWLFWNGLALLNRLRSFPLASESQALRISTSHAAKSHKRWSSNRQRNWLNVSFNHLLAALLSFLSLLDFVKEKRDRNNQDVHELTQHFLVHAKIFKRFLLEILFKCLALSITRLSEIFLLVLIKSSVCCLGSLSSFHVPRPPVLSICYLVWLAPRCTYWSMCMCCCWYCVLYSSHLHACFVLQAANSRAV